MKLKKLLTESYEERDFIFHDLCKALEKLFKGEFDYMDDQTFALDFNKTSKYGSFSLTYNGDDDYVYLYFTPDWSYLCGYEVNLYKANVSKAKKDFSKLKDFLRTLGVNVATYKEVVLENYMDEPKGAIRAYDVSRPCKTSILMKNLEEQNEI